MVVHLPIEADGRRSSMPSLSSANATAHTRSATAPASDEQRASSSRPLLLDDSISPIVHWRRATDARLGRAREAQSPGDSGVDFPPDWTPDRGSGVSGCCCPMDTGLGGLFGPRPRPLTMRVRERGRGPNRKEGWWWTRGGFGRWVGGRGDRESEKEQQSNGGGARVGGRGCGVVVVCGVGGVWRSAAAERCG